MKIMQKKIWLFSGIWLAVIGMAVGETYLIQRESWPEQQLEGWSQSSVNWSLEWSGEALDGAGLSGVYAQQPVAFPATDAFVADASASGGVFSGDYFDSGKVPLSVSFDFLARDILPSLALFRMIGVTGATTNTFFISLTNQLTVAGSWSHIVIPLQYDEGDWIGGNAESFTNSLGDVQRLEVRVTRNGTAEQKYLIDNFTLTTIVPGNTATNDVDGDGIPDYWEIAHFGGATNSMALIDSDGDNVVNIDEYVAGTDPNDKFSYFRINSISAEGDQKTIWVTSVLGRRYGVGWKQTLNDLAWTWTTNRVPATGGYIGIPNTNSLNKAFYRLTVELEE